MISAEEKYFNKRKKSKKEKVETIVKDVSQENGKKPDITKIVPIRKVKLKDFLNNKDLDKKKTSQMRVESKILFWVQKL